MASPNASKLPSRLAAGLEALGLSVPAPASDKLLNFVAELEKWNAAYNLTAVRDPADMVTRHVIDSLSLLPVLASHAGPVLDVGAGLGYWRDWYATTHPKVKRLSVDISEHACEKYSHECHDIASWFPTRQFDLVVCHSVLQYLNDKQAIAAIGNLAKATRGVLYLEVPTSADLRNAVDKKTTDLNIYTRTGDWYRKRLNRHFVQAGAGLWVARGNGTTLYELERSR